MADFDKLINDIIRNPELVMDKDTINDDLLLDIYKQINPYVNLSDTKTDEKRLAACSYTNLREDYIKRFTMTSLVSFIFQMSEEYVVPKSERFYAPKMEDSDMDKEPFNLLELKQYSELINNVVNDLEEVENVGKEILCSEDYDKDLMYKNDEKKIGILYTITTIIKKYGMIADFKLNATQDISNKYPEVKKLTKSRNLLPTFKEFEFPEENAKNVIYSFLKSYLEFDPSVHIRSGKEDIKTEVHKELGIEIVPYDDTRIVYERLKTTVKPKDDHVVAFKELTSNMVTYNSVLHILRDENLHDPINTMLCNKKDFLQYLLVLKSDKNINVPPQDTFHRWNYYSEVNFEELRTVTESIYPEKPDLDWAIAIWNIFTGSTNDDVKQQFDDYCQKHQDEFPSSIKALELGNWTVLGDFKNNRKNIEFYNKHTDVIKKIIDRHTEDKKIGSELMRNRVRQTKAKNIEEHGPDAPGLKQYRSTISGEGKDLTSKGVERVISPEEMKRLEKTQGNIKAARELEVLEEYEKLKYNLDDIKKYRDLTDNEQTSYEKALYNINQAKEMLSVPDDTIQVDVFTTDSKTGEFSKSHFYTKCEEVLEKENTE